jgi:Fe-S cluster biogenesis protein NfuA
VIEQDAVEDALVEARTLVQADGGDMEVVGLDAATGTVRLRLVLDGVECHECVMPRPFLEDIVGGLLGRAVPAVTRVEIDDPREHPDYVSPDGH